MVADNHGRLPDKFEKFVEFQNGRNAFYGRMPNILDYVSRRKQSKRTKRNLQRLLLTVMSLVLLFLAAVLHQYFLYFLLAIAGIWILHESSLKRQDRKIRHRSKT